MIWPPLLPATFHVSHLAAGDGARWADRIGTEPIPNPIQRCPSRAVLRHVVACLVERELVEDRREVRSGHADEADTG